MLKPLRRAFLIGLERVEEPPRDTKLGERRMKMRFSSTLDTLLSSSSLMKFVVICV